MQYSANIYFRNTNGRYQPYILAVTLNYCELAEKYKNGNPLVQRLIKFIVLHDKTVLDGCPIKGPYNMRDFELNSVVLDYLPPIIPEGDYLYHDHLHSSANHTYVAAKIFFNVKSVGLMDLNIMKVG